MPKKLEEISTQGVSDFETLMLSKNFVLGKYTVQLGTASQIISTNNQDDMLRQADEYNQRTNPPTSVLYVLSASSVIKTVLHKEVNTVNKTVTYMFQKYDNTFVKLTMATV